MVKIIKIAQARGSSAKTTAGAKKYLLANLPPEITGRQVAKCRNGIEAATQYHIHKMEHRADGRAKILGYNVADPNTPGRIQLRAHQDNNEWENRRVLIPTRNSYGEIIRRLDSANPRPEQNYWAALDLITEAEEKGKIPQAYDSIGFDSKGRADGDACHHEMYDFCVGAVVVCIRRTEGTKYGVRTLSKTYSLITRHGRGIRVTPAIGTIAKWAKAAGDRWGLVIRRLQGDKNAIALTNPLKWETAYKSVATDGDNIHSIFTGEEYKIGLLQRERAEDDHNGGYYCYGSVAEALQAEVPETSKMIDAPRAIVLCLVAGRQIKYGKKISRTYLRPIEIIASVLQK